MIEVTQAAVSEQKLVPLVMRNWYAAYVTARHEKAVAEYLAQKHVECYLPLYSAIHYWNKRKARVQLPLFPSYVFIHIALHERLQVVKVPGVVHIVSFNGIPAAVPDQEIGNLRAALSLRSCQPWPYLAPGNRIRIKVGPLQGLEGVLVRQNSSSRIIISLDFIQRSACVELEPWEVECLP